MAEGGRGCRMQLPPNAQARWEPQAPHGPFPTMQLGQSLLKLGYAWAGPRRKGAIATQKHRQGWCHPQKSRAHRCYGSSWPSRQSPQPPPAPPSGQVCDCSGVGWKDTVPLQFETAAFGASCGQRRGSSVNHYLPFTSNVTVIVLASVAPVLVVSTAAVAT